MSWYMWFVLRLIHAHQKNAVQACNSKHNDINEYS